MEDEHEDIPDQRIDSRRASDVESVGEVRLLRHELDALRKEVVRDETDWSITRKRLDKLEKHVIEFERKFVGIKGVFYGAAFVLVTIGYLIVDRVKELFIK